MKKILKFTGISIMLTVSVIACDLFDKEPSNYYTASTHVLEIDAAVKSRYPSAYLTSIEYSFDTVTRKFPPVSLTTKYLYNLYDKGLSTPSAVITIDLNNQPSELNPVETNVVDRTTIPITPVGIITIDDLFSLIHYEWEGQQPLIAKVVLNHFWEKDTPELMYRLWNSTDSIGQYKVYSEGLKQY